MTTTPQRPVPQASTPDQQRLEVELLLAQPVAGLGALLEAGPQRWQWPTGVSRDECQRLGCLPYRYAHPQLWLAVPTHWGEGERLNSREAFARSGMNVEFTLALHADIQSVFTQEWAEASAEPASAEAEQPPVANAATSNRSEPGQAVNRLKLLEHVALDDESVAIEAAPDNDPNDLDLDQAIQGSQTSPVINLVNRILAEALERNVSDIHVEPREDSLAVRFRQDGVLEEVEQLPKHIIPAVTSRLKIIADLDIAERRVPQDGRIRQRYKGRTFDLRVSTLPTRYGEKVCMRLLDSGATQLGLDKLITDERSLQLVRSMGHKPFGMILVTGPTGSGKSTTLYSLLAERNSPEINISTVEDPIEYTLKGISQTQVNRDKGYDFATALRAFMRQDPDVLLVGETRDLETAKTAIEAALTGHLVLTTLHCNDATSAISRLEEMGVETFLMSASLIGIISQRLVRRVCKDCRVAYHPSEQELAHFGLFAHDESNVTFYKAHKHGDEHDRCPTCLGLGYKGRVGIYEVLRINESLSAAIAQNKGSDTIRRIALESGMKTLLGYGLELVRQGLTTLEEIDRMVLTDSGLEAEQKAKALHSVRCRGCDAGLRDEWLECPYCLTPRQLK